MNETKQSETPIVDADDRPYPQPEYLQLIQFEGATCGVISPESYEALYGKARELELENRRLREELSNIETHLSVHEMRTHRPLHMDVLHLCGDAGQWKECAKELAEASDALREYLTKYPSIKDVPDYVWLPFSSATLKTLDLLQK